MIKQLKDNYGNYIFFLLLFFLPTWRWVENILLVFLSLTFILSANKSKINLRHLGTRTLIIFSVYIFLRTAIAQSVKENIAYLVKLIPLILIPVVLAPLKKENINKGFIFFSLGVVAMQLMSLYGIIDYYYFTDGKKIGLINNSQINEILGFERPYLGFFSAINVIVSYHLYKIYEKRYYWLGAALSCFLVFLISARLAALIIMISLAFILFKELKGSKYKIITIVVFLIGIILSLFIFKNPLMHRFSYLKLDARNIIWRGAFEKLNNDKTYILGDGNQQNIQNHLLKYYQKNIEYKPEKERFVREKYNTHNQYINEVLRGGVIGLLLFIMPFLVSLWRNIPKLRVVPILLLISILLFCMVENVLERQKGIYLLAVILVFSNKIYERK